MTIGAILGLFGYRKDSEQSQGTKKADEPCFSPAVLEQLEKKGEAKFRGHQLSHVMSDEHLGGLSEFVQNYLKGIEQKQEKLNTIVSVKDQLAPIYLVPMKDGFQGLGVVKTKNYLEDATSKVEYYAVRIETLRTLSETFSSIMVKAEAVHKELAELNNKKSSESDIASFKETVFAPFESAKNDLKEQVKKVQAESKYINIIKASKQNFGTFTLHSGMITFDPKGKAALKSAKCMEVMIEEVSKYQKVFESCMKGIVEELPSSSSSSAPVQDRSLSDDSSISYPDSDIDISHSDDDSD